MAVKLLKLKAKRRIAPGGTRTPARASLRDSSSARGMLVASAAVAEVPSPSAITLVGTYKDKQLAWIRRHGLYNYPVRDEIVGRAGSPLPAAATEDDLSAFGAKVGELWLYADAKGRRHAFEVTDFVGVQTRVEFLTANPTYPKAKAAHAERYLVFRTKPLDYGPRLDGSLVLARAIDFTSRRTAKIAKAIAQYERDGQFAPLEAYLPIDLATLPRTRLRVCEAAVQQDFMTILDSQGKCLARSIDYFKEIRDTSIAKALGLETLRESTGFSHVDCFSGVGGFCTGLHAAGFTTLVAIEKIKSCVETYQRNHPEVHVVNNDIRKVGSKDVVPYCPGEGVDLVTSGMPCETFSTAGNTSRSFYDERQFLFREGIRIATMTNAKFLLFENVPAITTKTVSKNSSELIIDVLKKEMVKAGYSNYIEVVLDSTKFGVPQRRKRYFVLGTRLKGVDLRKPVSKFSTCFTVGDAFADLPPVVPNSWQEGKTYNGKTNPFVEIMRDDSFWRRKDYTTSDITYHMPMKHRPATLSRFALIKPGEGLRDLFERYSGKEREKLQARHVLPKKMFIKRNCRLVLSEPSSTVTSHCLEEFVHPVEDRALTVRECARLQSFPDSYDFAGGPYIVPHIDREVQDKYEQIGDAVPPLLAYAWGRVITELLKEYGNGNEVQRV